MYGYDLIVADAEFLSVGKKLKNYCNSLQEKLETYRGVLDDMCATAVKSGNLRDALILYKEYVDKTAKALDGLGEKCEKLVGEFLGEIEKADKYLYESGRDSVRNFSDAQYELLTDCLDNPLWSWTDGIDDSWHEFRNSFIGRILGLERDYDKAEEWYKDLLDYNDETAAGLKYLFEQVYMKDVEYGRRDDLIYSIIADWECGHVSDFLKVAHALEGIKRMIDAMAELIGIGKDGLTSTLVQERLGKEYYQLFQQVNAVQIMKNGEIEASIEDIIAFSNNPDAADSFFSFYTAQAKFMKDNGFMDTASMVLFNMFEIAGREVIFHDYKKNRKKKLLMENIEKMAVTELYNGTEKEEAVDSFKEILGYFDKYGNDWYKQLNEARGADGKKILDGRTKAAKTFKSFLDSVEGAEKILKYGDEALEFLAMMLADYSKGLEIIDSFKKNATEGSETYQCLQEIENEYNDRFGTWIKEKLEGAIEKGVEWLGKELVKELPCLGIISQISKGIDYVGDVTEVGDMADCRLDAMFYMDTYSASNEAYLNAWQKLRDTDPNSPEYETLAKDLNNCFEFNKSNLVRMLENMAGASFGTERSYYEYCTDQAKAMSITNPKPDMLTYDEYVKKYGA